MTGPGVTASWKPYNAKHRRNDGGYDIAAGTGLAARDSAYTSHVLKYKYGMNPLTVTWAPHKYTGDRLEEFRENWPHVGGHDNLLFTPNGKLHRYLTRLAFINLLHPFQLLHRRPAHHRPGAGAQVRRQAGDVRREPGRIRQQPRRELRADHGPKVLLGRRPGRNDLGRCSVRQTSSRRRRGRSSPTISPRASCREPKTWRKEAG